MNETISRGWSGFCSHDLLIPQHFSDGDGGLAPATFGYVLSKSRSLCCGLPRKLQGIEDVKVYKLSCNLPGYD